MYDKISGKLFVGNSRLQMIYSVEPCHAKVVIFGVYIKLIWLHEGDGCLKVIYMYLNKD